MVKTTQLTVTPTTAIEDEAGNSYTSIFIKIGLQGYDLSSSETEDFIGWYGIPYKDEASANAGKAPIRIPGLNPTINPNNPRRQSAPTFGARAGSSEFTYATEHDGTTNKIGLTTASMNSLVDTKIKSTIESVNVGTKEAPNLIFAGATFA